MALKLYSLDKPEKFPSINSLCTYKGKNHNIQIYQIYTFLLTWIVTSNISFKWPFQISWLFHTRFLFKHIMHKLLYLLAEVVGQYQDYHMRRLHALMSKNPHPDDLHLLLSQLEFQQQRHYHNGHTEREKRLVTGFSSWYYWIYRCIFFFSLWGLFST